MATILGLSCFYHDSAACLVRDGGIVAAAQEERFTRIKHDSAFPEHAVDFVLREGQVAIKDLDAVVFYEKPLLKFDRLLASWLQSAPVGFPSFLAALPNWLKEKLFHPKFIRRKLGGDYKKAVLFSGHHASHAASAFYPSPFESAAVLTIDGVGEWETVTLSHARNGSIEPLESIRFPHSLGLLYSAFTYYLGFRVNSGEYKVMGLAPYGEPVYRDLILDKLVDLKADGSFRLDMRYFNYVSGLTMTSRRFHDLFGGPPRSPERPLSRREMNIAASLQSVTESIVLAMARYARKQTGERNLCLAGGVALNSVANGKVMQAGIFDKVWIQPAAGDAGGAVGAALDVAFGLFQEVRTVVRPDAMHGALLGDAFEAQEIETTLQAAGAVYTRYDCQTALLKQTVQALAAGKVVGWFQGRMEFGPRALGNRSILGDPRSREMQRMLNRKIKFRESFRPFAPVVLADAAQRYFKLQDESPYMLVVDQVRPEWLVKASSEINSTLDGDDYIRELLESHRSSLPAVTHVDNSARIQTVDTERNPVFSRLLKEWEAETGCPVLVNTSFNIRGEPIVHSPADALRCFLGTEMDVLVMGDFFLDKIANRHLAVVDESYRESFPLD